MLVVYVYRYAIGHAERYSMDSKHIGWLDHLAVDTKQYYESENMTMRGPTLKVLPHFF